jgi:hypothetical protein
LIKISRREAMTFLLGGLAALGGLTSSSEKSSLPERCKRQSKPKSSFVTVQWEMLPYHFTDFDKAYAEWVLSHRGTPHSLVVLTKGEV